MDCRQLNEPSEVEAWKTMMDSMIKFIQASTKLMNTYNQKASNQILPSLCELECPPCLEAQRNTPRRCSANVSQKQQISQNNDVSSNASQKQQVSQKNDDPTNVSQKQQISPNNTDGTPIHVDDSINLNDYVYVTSKDFQDTTNNDVEIPEGEETPLATSAGTDKESSDPTELPSTNVTAPTADETPLAESSGNDQGSSSPSELPSTNEDAPTADKTPLAQSSGIDVGSSRPSELPSTNKDPPTADGTPLVESTRIGEASPTPMPETKSGAVEGVKKAGGDICVCKEVKQIKSIISQAGAKPDSKGKAGKCGCGKKKSKPQLCACPVTSKETANLTESMVQKLEKAQGEIDGLKEELQKLQFMESTRKSNSAALYREIMKETSLDTGPPLRSSTPIRRAAAQKTASNTCPLACTPSQTRRYPNGMPPPIRSNNPTLSFAPSPDTGSYGQTVCRPPIVTSTPRTQQRIGDISSISSGTRWSQQTQSRQTPDLVYNQSKYFSDVRGPTQSGTSQRWYEESYCPVQYNTNQNSRFLPIANSTPVQGPTQSGTSQQWYENSYSPAEYNTNQTSRFLPIANSTPAYPQRQYNEVECVFKRPKNAQKDKIQSFRTPPATASEFYPANDDQIRGYQSVNQAATVYAPPRPYAQPSIYQDPRSPYGTEDYDDQLCDDNTCGNDECENH